MKLFSRIATSALTSFAILGCASSALAAVHQPFNSEESRLVLEAVQRVGGVVSVDTKECKERTGLMGYATRRGNLVVCASNHGDDLDELGDTIRHEALHLAQFCRGMSTGTVSALLAPDIDTASYTRDILGQDLSGHYSSAQHATEAEARALANYLDEYQVAAVIIEECL